MNNFRQHCLSAFTLSILLFGTLGMMEAISGSVVRAAQLIIIAALMDGVDGTLARALKGESAFGARLDTFVDTICFGVAPAILAYTALCSGQNPAAAFAAFIVFAIIMSGVIRFTRGGKQDEQRGIHAFRGLPIPVSAIWLCLFVLLRHSETTAGLPMQAALSMFMGIFTGILLVLQVTNLNYRKPHRQHFILSLIITATMIVVTHQPLLALACCTGIAIVIYVIATPLMERASINSSETERVALDTPDTADTVAANG
ncbi:MAG: CDP-alcohol phosphatidyltransferase family protein [Kiritimatiellae bacterium]|nr:CDP-alcohol phosphatidyltransferase family protein [Kiritimatiellia bacterium]